MKTYGRVEAKLHAFSNTALNDCEQPASVFGHFTAGERAPGTYLVGDWVGFACGKDIVALPRVRRPARGRSLAGSCRMIIGFCSHIKPPTFLAFIVTNNCDNLYIVSICPVEGCFDKNLR
jgi:hypothetical protein